MNSVVQPVVSPLQEDRETIHLLVVSRNAAALPPLLAIVESNRWEVETAASAWEALERVQSGLVPDVVILDVPNGDGDGLHILRWLRRLRPEVPTLMLCHVADVEKRKDALRMGADDVLLYPVTAQELEFAIRRAANSTELSEFEAAAETVEAVGDDKFLVSASFPMRKLREQVELLSQTDVPVLIVGEKGTGKETIARLIHRLSVRSGFRFLKVNCTALTGDALDREIFGTENSTAQVIPSSKLALAGKGTLLIEEVAELPLHLQSKLMEVLQNHSFMPRGGSTAVKCDVRILAATSANLEHALTQGKLRPDLHHRLSAYTVHVPPLRRRNADIPLLLQHFMHSLSQRYGLPARDFSEEVLGACEKYTWPGNVQELETFVKRYLAAGNSEIVFKELMPEFHAASPETGPEGDAGHDVEVEHESEPHSLKSLIHSIKSETERSAIAHALEKTGWNRKAAARLLQVSYRSLLYKIEQYQMHSSETFLSPGSKGLVHAAGTKGRTA